jgi:hypothetical protein
MRALRVITGAIGTFVSLFACAPFAVEWVSHDPSAVTSVVGPVFSLAALTGPFALFMAASLSEGQYTRGNRRLLLVCLSIGAAIALLSLLSMLRAREYLFGGAALLTITCIVVVGWCIVQKKEENA